MLIFQRKIEEEILNRVQKRGFVIILGPRQAGKTTLAKRILSQLNAEDGYFNCELHEVRRAFVLGDPKPLRELVGEMGVVVFDEAQTIENIGKIFKIFHDTYPEIKIIATGSSAFDLANKIREPLTGRADEFMLYPLSMDEIRTALPIDTAEFNALLSYGLYPAVVAAQGAEAKARELKRIATNYLYKDVFTFEALRNPKAFEDLVTHLAVRQGGMISANDLANEIGVAPKTVESYIRLLEQSYVIKRVYSFSRNHANELKKSYKVYFIDIGVRNVFSGETFQTDDTVLLGGRLEAMVFSEFQKSDTLCTFPPRTHFWRTHDKKEIDFVRIQGDTIDAYEVKWSDKEVSFNVFKKAYPHASTQVLTPSSLLGGDWLQK